MWLTYSKLDSSNELPRIKVSKEEIFEFETKQLFEFLHFVFIDSIKQGNL